RWPGGEPLDTPCVEGEEKGKAAGEMERGGWGLLSESAGARVSLFEMILEGSGQVVRVKLMVLPGRRE
ncbi:hypothetical protein JOQ06_028978, partial [Pogonophryne albipinna]